MSGGNSDAVLNASFALNAKNNCLTSIHIVDFFARLQCFAELVKTLITVCLSDFLNPSGNLTLRFTFCKKFLVALAEIVTFS